MENTADSLGGGAIAAIESTLNIKGSEICFNESDPKGMGGGIYFNTLTTEILILNKELLKYGRNSIQCNRPEKIIHRAGIHDAWYG